MAYQYLDGIVALSCTIIYTMDYQGHACLRYNPETAEDEPFWETCVTADDGAYYLKYIPRTVSHEPCDHVVVPVCSGPVLSERELERRKNKE